MNFFELHLIEHFLFGVEQLMSDGCKFLLSSSAVPQDCLILISGAYTQRQLDQGACLDTSDLLGELLWRVTMCNNLYRYDRFVGKSSAFETSF